MDKKPTNITESSEIDLNKSAVIEASAGTGKTYTIENLVVRLLIEKKVPIEKILVVTFTEKATGEIRERVRRRIEDRSLEASITPADKDRLRVALEGFDNASIFTIHGFCSRVLKQYAFENGEPFMSSQEDDTLLYEKVLKEQMRTSWRSWFGDKLGMLLQASGFAGNEEWVGDVARLAGDYRPHCGDVLNPAVPADPKDTITDFARNAQKIADALVKLVGPIDPGNLECNDFIVRYGNLKIQSNWLESRRNKVILPLLKLLSAYTGTKELDHNAFSRFIEGARHAKRYDHLIDNRMITSGAYKELCPKLEEIIEALNKLESLYDSFPALLKSAVIMKLKKEVAEYKRKRGLVSFDDMIEQVDTALAPGSALVDELRKRYSCALVDEFQDTDKVQWSVFRKAFIGSEKHRIFIIGDPKQAIYSFRGADVFAYINAKKELLEKEGANYYSLAVNWRSTEPLTDAYNKLFGSDRWFSGPDIKYLNVKPPATDKRKSRIYLDKTGRAAMTAVDLEGAAKTQGASVMLARFIAEEIERLLDNDGENLIIEKGGGRGAGPLEPGDICVLVKAKKDAKLVQRYLERKKIPCSFYKNGGLYSSDEAIHLRYLLGSIVDISDEAAFKKALLTPFFDIKLPDIERYSDLSPDSAVAQLFRRWREYADERRWPELFQSLLEDTGISYKESVGERRLVNYQHILEKLGTEAISRNLDLVEIVALMGRYRKQNVFKDETFDLHRLETEKSKVKFITIHSSKGMEFPVVFIAGGFGAFGAGHMDVWKYHDPDNNNTVVYDLAKSNSVAFAQERDREDRQLYYVALTRAKYKLYFPRITDLKSAAGPVRVVLNAALDAAWPERASDSTMLRFVDHNGGELKKEPMLEVVLDKEKPAEVKTDTRGQPVAPDPLFPDAAVNFEDRKIEIESYSHLKEKVHQPSGGKQAQDTSWIIYYDRETAGVKEDDDVRVAGEDDGEAAPELPRGNVTGSMLHEIMEAIDFTKAGARKSGDELLKDKDVEGIIERKLRRFGMIDVKSGPGAGIDAESMKRMTANIVWNTLKATLPGEGFTLSQLSGEDKLHEIEFYYPFPKPADTKLKDIKYKDGYLMGYIDLVFRVGGKYYILDWKSNYIVDGYGRDVIDRNMEESGYDLQYKVYSVAVLRWLKKTIRDFDYGKHFGGVYYIYMRGMDALKKDQGVFFVRPDSEAAVKVYEDELHALLNPKLAEKI